MSVKEPRFVYREYTTSNTAALLRELIADPYYMTRLGEEILSFGDFSPTQLRHFLHEEFFLCLQTSLLDIDWQQLADEINVQF